MREEINYDDFREIESRIDSMTNVEELIEAHKKLIGHSAKCDYCSVEDCGVSFIKKFLSRDYKRTKVYNYSQGAQKFIHSKYLSDYFKSSIKELLAEEVLSEQVINLLNSAKLINEMSEEEILSIYSAIKEFYNKTTESEFDTVISDFMLFLYKLNGSGVVSFIKNNVNTRDLASHILLTSGLSDSASYYSGCGVNYDDLNEENLFVIFSKLLKIEVDYAINFVEMVRQMKTLGATEFINSFMSFAVDGFKLNTQNIEESNFSLDGVYDEARGVAFSSIVSVVSRGNDQEYQIRVSERIKRLFMSKSIPVLKTINPDYDGLNNQSFNSYKYTKRK